MTIDLESLSYGTPFLFLSELLSEEQGEAASSSSDIFTQVTYFQCSCRHMNLHGFSARDGGGWCGESVVYLTSPGRPTDTGLQLGKACYPCSR